MVAGPMRADDRQAEWQEYYITTFMDDRRLISKPLLAAHIRAVGVLLDLLR